MHTTNFKVTLFFILTLFISFVQGSETKKWGKVDPQYLKMTVYPQDTSAAAVKIFDVGEYDVRLKNRRFQWTLTHHYQIKILKESGKKYADVAIEYWHEDKILKLKAQTILPNGKKIKLKKKQIFDESLKKKYKIKKFAMPAVEVGSIIEVEYKLLSKYVTFLEPWIFQDEIPTIESVVVLTMSPGFIYHVKPGNDFKNRIQIHTEEYFDVYEDKDLKKYIYRAVNLPAVKKEPYISTLKNYKARLDFQIIGYKTVFNQVKFIEDLPTLIKELLDGKYGSFLKPQKQVKSLVESLKNTTTNNRDLIRNIYTYVRDQLEDEDEYTSYYTFKKQKDILKTKKASPSERNLFLISMLKAAGFDAKPVLISTREHGRIDPQIPFLDQYNRTIAMLKYNQEVLLLDASDRFVPFGLLPPESYVDTGLIVEKGDVNFVKIPRNALKGQEILNSQVEVDIHGTLHGKTQVTATGYASLALNRKLDKYGNIEEFLHNVFGEDNSNFEITDSDSLLKPAAKDSFTTNFKFTVNEFAEMVEDEIYFKPGLFHSMDKNLFVSETREFPVEFGYRFNLQEYIIYTFPREFEIVEIPQNVMIRNKYFVFYRVLTRDRSNPNKLIYSRKFMLLKHTVPPSYYSNLKKFFAVIVDADQAQVVLRSKQGISSNN